MRRERPRATRPGTSGPKELGVGGRRSALRTPGALQRLSPARKRSPGGGGGRERPRPTPGRAQGAGRALLLLRMLSRPRTPCVRRGPRSGSTPRRMQWLRGLGVAELRPSMEAKRIAMPKTQSLRGENCQLGDGQITWPLQQSETCCNGGSGGHWSSEEDPAIQKALGGGCLVGGKLEAPPRSENSSV